MKKLIYTTILLLFAAMLMGCKTKTVYVPVREIQTEIEILDRWSRDSIYVHDSVFVAHKGDTVFREKYQYVYRDKVVKDSVWIRDSVRVEVPYPVIETREVNRLKGWQIFLMCLGGGMIGWWMYRLVRFLRSIR